MFDIARPTLSVVPVSSVKYNKALLSWGQGNKESRADLEDLVLRYLQICLEYIGFMFIFIHK